MSHGRSKRNKERRKKLFQILPELKVVHRFIRFKGIPRYTLGKAKDGSAIKSHPKGEDGQAMRSKIYVHPWPMQSTFTKEMQKAVASRRKRKEPARDQTP